VEADFKNNFQSRYLCFTHHYFSMPIFFFTKNAIEAGWGENVWLALAGAHKNFLAT
jgi:hypothetical protein